jgi:large subunit ribosomal protein L4
MAEIEIRNWKNKKVGSLALDEAVFDYPLKEHLIYEAVCAYRAAGRAGTHATKNRKNVSGGGRKPWRQKGTGRARAGDNRSPLWRHGGTAHGPHPRDYSWKFPRKMRINALRSALAQKLREGKLVCVDTMEFESHKTGELEQAMGNGLGISGKVLLVHEGVQGGGVQNLVRAAGNNPRLKVHRALGMSIVDLLDCEVLVASESAIKQLNEVLAP